MAQHSSIEWTDSTWNPVTGCTKVSQGCKNCYAERMAIRLRAMGVDRYKHGFALTLQEDLIEAPLKWKKPRMIFVNSMSDLFHEHVPLEYIQRVFATMMTADWHIYQILTKRSDRLLDLSAKLPWPSNVWMGVSVESDKVRFRINHLAEVPAQVRFVSCEPLLGPLMDLPLQRIHWVIVGGESGPRARPMEAEWVEQIKAQCDRSQIPFFFKQWGGVRKDLTGRLLAGKTFDDLPSAAYKHPYASEILDMQDASA